MKCCSSCLVITVTQDLNGVWGVHGPIFHSGTCWTPRPSRLSVVLPWVLGPSKIGRWELYFHEFLGLILCSEFVAPVRGYCIPMSSWPWWLAVMLLWVCDPNDQVLCCCDSLIPMLHCCEFMDPVIKCCVAVSLWPQESGVVLHGVHGPSDRMYNVAVTL